ncbi:MAG: CRISPR-associated endonuclease Cas1 [Saprospiraceae bacterium]|nr:CRISPR-associated endonuclease Cas1 [Saprospiraceae bacterium]
MQVYINTPGCKVSIKEGHLVVYPPKADEAAEVQRVPLRQIETVFVHRATLLTAELAFAAVEHDIDVQFVDRRGKPEARLWSSRFGSISVIRKKQALFVQSLLATAWVQQLLAEKCEHQAALLLSLPQPAEETFAAEAAIKISEYRTRILAAPQERLSDAAPKLRALEAAASKTYFQALSTMMPPQYRFAQRSQHPATDMFNCLLNYAYGILYGKVEHALIRAGVDPFIGIFHRDEYNRPVLVYDVIEKFRHWADFVVCRLCKQEVIFLEFFEVEQGAFWLNPYGKRILIQAFADYMDEVIIWQKMERSRYTHIDLAAQGLATLFKGFE